MCCGIRLHEKARTSSFLPPEHLDTLPNEFEFVSFISF